ncbi:hypothetical protein SAMN05444398_1011052 [Roseovarius pacificus]|uniref:Uncharacterized protein n=1 Tax=Roseovarius pacificus TaxID=337701 RepID=A0A1M6YV81_9RHOB|nr:hypothetical protein [Roseovarius pacificus]GGO50321.1 hypothetical protein GCM10011315_00810 [Roseovarius pacificus]SHL22211.1 hypothetical protein SAMN05444398_1011052 [Roseovarius pacificus]
MDDSIFDDPGSVVTFVGGGDATNYDPELALAHLSKAERKKAVAKRKAHAEKIRRWQEARSDWTPEMVAAENEELERQKQAILEARHAA